RGPDQAGTFADDRAGLVHRRLSIVDLATGRQPLANEDDRVWIVFNGEIYNHADIRRQLEQSGHAYRTRSDTETIVHAYEQWGDACVERLRGMFAFAIWDAPRRRLLLARDRLGVKPLYWTLVGRTLVFGSEIKAVLKSGIVPPRANRAAIPELLATRYLSGADTMFAGVSKLMPGHLLVFEDGQARVRKYWDIPVEGSNAAAPASASERPRSFRAAVERFRELLTESVRLRLMSDVPLGMFLSGGLDSSAVAALMAGMVDRQLQTFSVAFHDRAYSELEYARQVVKAVGAQGHEVVIDEQDFFGALPRLVWHEDEPIAHPSSVPLYFVSRLAREHVKVVLTGEGSDELMAGYGKYPRALWNWRLGGAWEAMMPAGARRFVANRLVPALPAAFRRYAQRSFLAVPHRAGTTFFDNFAAVPLRDQQRLLAAGSAATEATVYGPSLAYMGDPDQAADLLQRVLYADMKTYLVELLMKQDQMSMAASIESRVPFLDHQLVEYVASLPSNWKLSGLTTKRLLREAAKGLLPREILERPKMGFPVPFGVWMRGPWQQTARDLLLDRRARERGVLDQPAVARLLAAHASGAINAGDRIWSLMNLELWFRTFIDGDGVVEFERPATTAAPNRTAMVA
ncbi:MAG: asparagine synthase (glutamine-hydrolyzing), partial [Bacteroidales bacterium]